MLSLPSRFVMGCLIVFGCLAAGIETAAAEQQRLTPVGVAEVDITPDFPVRLNGFGFRREESEGVDQRLWAKAIAIGEDEPVVLITADQCIVTAEVTEAIAQRLEAEAGVSRARFALSISHSHTTPMLTNAAPTLFGVPIPDDHQQRIDRYTQQFIDGCVEAALAALENREPASLAFTQGSVGFAHNRRPQGGPVDHDLPTMIVRDEAGEVRAIYVSYACHCVTMRHNRITGDWAGFAQEQLQEAYPDAVALVAIGAGADQNPTPADGDLEVAAAQGRQIVDEVQRLMRQPLRPIEPSVQATFETMELPFDEHPTRDEWEQRAEREDAIGHHARTQLARLDAGESLRTHVDYPIQTWRFGNDLAMVFLGGEVVVDYSLRLKAELDPDRLWVNAYSNDVPGYIPSERILEEGGYEAEGAMTYYDQPTRFAAGLEDRIIARIHEQVGPDFAGPDTSKTGGIAPRDATAAIPLMQTHDDLRIELAAAEPVVVDPVAIEWGPDGRLWVAEMRDYPAGMDGEFNEPGGRIVYLEDTTGDGRYDSSTVFLDDLPFPTGVLPWRKGVLICAAPDILYAEDTTGDGKADKVDVLFTGFGTDNYQARVNALTYGLDGWVYGSCGLFGGEIESFALDEPVTLGNRDFRIRPDTGEIEPATGRSQQGRIRNDAGDWFGNDNSTFLRHLALADHYIRRNRHYAPPDPNVYVPDEQAARVFPITDRLPLLELTGEPGRATAACGPTFYRDDLLGEHYAGHAFVCEPVNLLVHRMQMKASGTTFTGSRAAGEEERSFLASRDPWFRPVQARTGPDGALYVVDMYRYVIEHPVWISDEQLAELDVRAGDDRGRIYRLLPREGEARPIVNLSDLDTPELVAAMDTPNGPQRDMAMMLLVWRADDAAAGPLEQLLREADRPLTRLHALCVLDGLNALRHEHLLLGLQDDDATVRRHAVRLCEGRFDDALSEPLLTRAADDDAMVRMQAAYTLGGWDDDRAGRVLGRMLLNDDDRYLEAAAMSSAPAHLEQIVEAVLAAEDDTTERRRELTSLLIAQAVAQQDAEATVRLIDAIANAEQPRRRFALLATLMQSAARQNRTLRDLADESSQMAEAVRRVEPIIEAARAYAADDDTDREARLAAVSLLGRTAERSEDDMAVLASLLSPRIGPELQQAALASLGRLRDDRVPKLVLEDWAGHSPALRAGVVELLLSRASWTNALLDELASRPELASGLSPARRQSLLEHSDAAIAERAAELLGDSADSNREQVVAAYEPVVTMQGDADRGREVFTANCAVCHTFNGEGTEIGPALGQVADRSARAMLIAILDPNRGVLDEYVTYVAQTDDGRTLAGLIANETASSITLTTLDGQSHTVLREELTSLTSTGRSLMPEGLEAAIPEQDMADLIAYLSTPVEPPKSFANNEPRTVRPADDGSLTLLATTAEIRGGDIVFEQPFKNVGYWQGENDSVTWRIDLGEEEAGRFDVYLDYSCASPGNEFVIDAGAESLTGTIEGTGGWDQFEQVHLGTLEIGGGQRRLTVRPAGPPQGALMDLRGIVLVPEGEPGPEGATAAGTASDAAAEVARLLEGLEVGTEAEYERIPAIWRAAIEGGRRNDAAEMRRLLELSLPHPGEPLEHWQAVVIGGGIINGMTQADIWPRERIEQIIGDDAELARRWRRAIDLSVEMADDDHVPAPTRYDALRMVAMAGWEEAADQLLGYLGPDADPELQMGAVSGLVDIDDDRVVEPLIGGIDHYADANLELALDGLMRTPQRTAALLDAVADGAITPTMLGEQRAQRLRELDDADLRQRARRLLD